MMYKLHVWKVHEFPPYGGYPEIFCDLPPKFEATIF